MFVETMSKRMKFKKTIKQQISKRSSKITHKSNELDSFTLVIPFGLM